MPFQLAIPANNRTWRLSFTAVALWLAFSPNSGAQQPSTYFAGVLGGIATLSADGRSTIASGMNRVSLYKPENGPGLQIVGGRHLSDYLSLQASWGWTRNSLSLTSSGAAGGESAFYEQTRRATQQSAIGELLLYFRNRKSFARPYLTVGGGFVRLTSGLETIGAVVGDLPPPGAIASTKPAIRVAVGIDLFLGNNWAFRFNFGETIRANPISFALTPPGQRNLADFQNLFGLVKYF